MVETLVDREKCIYCAGCVSVCPVDAISLNETRIQIDQDKCTGCGACVAFCPVMAMTMR